eukprot:g6329.t1
MADTNMSPQWDERWSDEQSKAILQKFAVEERKMHEAPKSKLCPWMPCLGAQGSVDDDSDYDLEAVKTGKVDEDGKFSNWASTAQSTPAKVFTPKTAEDVKNILAEARAADPSPKIRCTGSSHSWTNLFADDGAWLVDTTGLKDITWSATETPTQVTIGPGVTCGELATFCDSKDRGEWRGMFLQSDVILETVTYGGVVNSACHGVGQTQTVCDYVVATSILKWDGTLVKLSRADDPEGFAKKIAHFGLLGITVDFTFQLDAKRTAIKVTDRKQRAREIFLERGQLPSEGGPNPLLDLFNDNYAVEIFYFPASSLEITNILSHEFEDQDWDEYKDICTLKIFNRTENAVGKDDDSFLGKDQKTSTRFDHNFSITDWIKINLGTQVALRLVADYGAKPALVSLYAKTAAAAFEPAFQTTGEVSYETSLAQAIHWQKYITDGLPVSDTEVCIKCDPDFTSAYKAIHETIAIIKSFAEDEDTMPLNVAMEMRFTKHSDSPLCPAFGVEGDVFLWIEILSATDTPRLKDFNTRVADAWLGIKLKDGSPASLPHWAKWSESYVADADAKLKAAFADRLPLLAALSVTLSKYTGSGKDTKKNIRAEQRKPASTRPQEQGNYRQSPSWATQATTDPQQQGKDKHPFLDPSPSRHEKQRIPADEQPFTVESGGGGLPSWWGSRSRAPATTAAAAAAAARRPSSPFLSSGEAFQEEPTRWSESSGVGGGAGAGSVVAYGNNNNNNNSGQIMAKAGYMPFDNEDRLGIFDTKRGGFDQQVSPAAEDDWRGAGEHHSPSGSGVSIAPAAAASGLDAWPSTYSSDIGEAWMRQAEGGGQQGPRQVGDGVQQQNRPGSASVSGPSKRLHEMKEYFRRSQRAPGGGSGHGQHDDNGSGHGGHPEPKQEYEQDHNPRRYPYFEGSTSSSVFRPRGGGSGGGGTANILPGLSGDISGNGFRREGSANDISIGSQDQGNGGLGVGELGDGSATGGIDAGNGGRGGVYGKNDQQQRSNIMPWQHEMINGNGYSPSPVSQHQDGGSGSNPAADVLPPVSIGGSLQNGGGGRNHNISNDGEDNGNSGIVGGGTDPGDVGSVEFDPQADCRPSVIGSHHNGHSNVTVSTGGGSPTSWWRDAPEPAASNFPWDLQLPNPAPPLALSSQTGSGGGSGGSGGGVGGGRGGGSGAGAGGPPASLMGGGSSVMSTIRGGGGGGGGATDHLRFGKPSSASLAGLGPAPSIGGGSHRHRGGMAEQHLTQSGSALDILENGGMRSGGSTILLDAVGRSSYSGGGGGLGRWGSNASPPSATEIAWGLGSSRTGSVSGGAADNYLSACKLEESCRRIQQQAPPCDSLIPPTTHASAYNVVPSNPRSLLHAGPLGGGSDRDGAHEFKTLSMASGDPEGVVFGRVGGGGGGRGDMPRAKRARVMKREIDSMRLSPSGSGVGLSSEEVAFGRLMEGKNSGGGGGGGGRSTGVAGNVGHGGQASARDAAGSWGGGGSGRGRDGGGGGSSSSSRAPTKKKASASSRRCRDESCNSHPNFGVEGDRKAIYCAKHKLPGMVNVKAPRCREPGCTRNPVYGNRGDPRATFCLSHKSPTMVDVKNRCCEHPGCTHQPSFGLVGDRRANFCFAHKLPTHVNIRRARARAS